MGFSIERFLHALEVVRRSGLSNLEAAESYDALVKEGYDYAVQCGVICELEECE